MLAEALEKKLGYRNISREMIYETARQKYGFSIRELNQSMEHAPSRFGHSDERLRLFIGVQAALCELVEEDQVVYHGRAGHLLLPDISHVLRVRLIAHRTQRIEMAVQREGLDREEARRKIDWVDAERSRWTQFVFGAQCDDPTHYDMVLNLERVTLDEAANITAKLARCATFRSTERSRRKMRELMLISRARVYLATSPSTANIGLKVSVAGDKVSIEGTFNQQERENIAGVLEKVEGINEVEIPCAGPRNEEQRKEP